MICCPTHIMVFQLYAALPYPIGPNAHSLCAVLNYLVGVATPYPMGPWAMSLVAGRKGLLNYGQNNPRDPHC